MKKSFTLKAFAFGAAATVALAASATPHEFLKVNQQPQAVKLSADETPNFFKLTLSKNGAAVATKAPAMRAEANYGDWAAAGEGTYTFSQMFSREVTANYNYELRNDNANPGNFQMKIKDWGKDILFDSAEGETPVDLVMTVTKESDGSFIPSLDPAGIPMGFDASYRDDSGATKSAPVYKFDYISWLRALKAAGEAITDANIESWKSLFSYDESTGVATYLPVYTLMIDGAVSWYAMSTSNQDSEGNVVSYKTESFRRLGGDFKNYDFESDATMSYFSHAKDAATGSYSVTYNMHDNALVAFRMLTGRKTGTALQTALQELVNALGDENMPDDIFVSQETSATVNVPVTSYRKGQYTLLVVYTDGIENANGNISFSALSNNSIRLFDDDVDFYENGTANFTDGMMVEVLQYVFNDAAYEALDLPLTYSSTVPLQASSKVEGEYRLVHPYSAYFNQYLADQLNYDGTADFMKFSTVDATKSYIEPSTTGIYYNTQTAEVMILVGSTNKFSDGADGAADVWGSYANNVLSFPEPNLDGAESLEDVVSALSFEICTSSTSGYTNVFPMAIPSLYAENTKIEGNFFSGIENVAADAEFDVNAPVEYFNLQGIRVATPEAGQLLIKRQGNKASKVVIR